MQFTVCKTQQPIKETKVDVVKKIMPNRCEVCSIGIGQSMLFFENAWRPFQHTMKEVHYFIWDKGRVKVCADCYEDLFRIKDPKKLEKYLTLQGSTGS